ncbi:MAG: 50S ribosomal protein L13 [Phycisphaerales bacterium]|nr:MAG: 50S ribosomal protein L13 [Phycisphaerales bacterium]
MSAGRIRTYTAKQSDVERRWYHLDASDQVLGRLATKIATVLMGKHKPTYTPHVDTGDFVVVTNVDKIRLTGKKADTVQYARYTYYPGGYKVIPFKRMFERHPERILTLAVRRMLPKNKLARHMLKKLKVYRGGTHPHAAQAPEPWAFGD